MRSLSNARSKPLTKTQRNRILGYIFLLPLALIVLGFVGYPFISAIWLSFTRKYVGTPGEFIGLKNYLSLFRSDTFWLVVRNSFIYTFSSVFLKMTLGMLVAKLLVRKFIGRDVVGGIFLISWVIPMAISALAWKWIFQDIGGILNWIILKLHLVSRAIPFLSIPTLALSIVVIVNFWRGLPFFALSFQGALKTIPRSQYDVAKIAGASPFQIFRYVEFPNIRSIAMIVLMLTMVWTFADFQVVWILTRGGPGNRTQVFATYTYELAIQAGDLGLGVTVSLVMFPLLGAMILYLTSVMSRARKER